MLSWRADGREILVATLSGHIVAYPVSTQTGFSAGQPTIRVRDVGIAAPFSTATRDHSCILIRVSPDAAKDKGCSASGRTDEPGSKIIHAVGAGDMGSTR